MSHIGHSPARRSWTVSRWLISVAISACVFSLFIPTGHCDLDARQQTSGAAAAASNYNENDDDDDHGHYAIGQSIRLQIDTSPKDKQLDDEANFNYNHRHHINRKQLLPASNDYNGPPSGLAGRITGANGNQADYDGDDDGDGPRESSAAQSGPRPSLKGSLVPSSRLLVRSKREPAKGARRLGKGTGLLLARHPTGRYGGTNRGTSTTTTTETTNSSPESANKDTTTTTAAAAVDDDDNASDDYEEIESPKSKPKVEEPAEEAEVEAEPGEEAGEEPEVSSTTTTTTTSTTQRPTTRRAGVGAGKSRKGKQQTTGTSSTSTKSPRTSRDEELEANNEESGSKQAANTRKSPEEDIKSGNKSATSSSSSSSAAKHHKKRKPLVSLPFIRAKNDSVCAREAYLEFPRDLIGNKWRARGLVLVHIAVVCYMFYSLALVCERYFMPSLEEFAQRLNLSEDVAGATLMSAGSSAPELFTAILGVFVAKGDVGTGTIVGSAVFNILFVIGVCAFVSTTSAQLQWWPVLRDSVYYAFTVLVLILFIYDERITAMESFTMIALYGLYILIMANNDSLKEATTRCLLSYPFTANLISSAAGGQSANINGVDGPDDVFGSSSSAIGRRRPNGQDDRYRTSSMMSSELERSNVEEDSVFMAAMLVIVQHKRLFRSNLRFQSAARYVIIKRQHRMQLHQRQHQKSTKPAKCSDEVNYFGPESEPLAARGAGQKAKMEAYANSSSLSKQKFSIVSKDDYEFWNRPPDEGENYYLWLAKIPVNYVLHYTIPDCSLYPDKYLITFFVSILWTAFFSYTMVWMVTLIGYTFNIPDSVMGVTFLAAGTSVPDCYSSVHAARNGMADMAVSNSIGSNVFDILIGLSLPWFIQTAIYPGVVATINSRGVIYSVILLFLSLIVTIYLLNKYEWTLKPRLGLALLIAYGLFIVLTCMLEFNLFGHVNPPPCPVG